MIFVFWAWLILLSMVISSSVNFPENDIISFYFIQPFLKLKIFLTFFLNPVFYFTTASWMTCYYYYPIFWCWNDKINKQKCRLHKDYSVPGSMSPESLKQGISVHQESFQVLRTTVMLKELLLWKNVIMLLADSIMLVHLDKYRSKFMEVNFSLSTA
jgi:hypothetical protein